MEVMGYSELICFTFLLLAFDYVCPGKHCNGSHCCSEENPKLTALMGEMDISPGVSDSSAAQGRSAGGIGPMDVPVLDPVHIALLWELHPPRLVLGFDTLAAACQSWSFSII